MFRSLVVLMLAATAAYAAPELRPMASAERCGFCHREIHNAWKTSGHANAMQSQLFQDALDTLESERGAAATHLCISCHSPIAVQLGDFALLRKVSWEGVTCDYCHSVRSVDESAPNPRAVVDYSLVKSGPNRDVGSVGHESVYSDVHTTSKICAPCHEYRNTKGLDVLTTYREWSESSYGKEDTQCQECHMPSVAGDIVDSAENDGAAGINLHEMPGSRSLDQLNKAVRLRVATERSTTQLNITVTIENVGAGHYVPTGSPARQLILDLKANAYGGEDFNARRIYSRVIADSDGKPIDLEHRIFLDGATTVSDTRLAPGETRVEKFTVPVATGIPVQVSATLTYFYSPMARTESEQQIRFRRVSRLIR